MTKTKSLCVAKRGGKAVATAVLAAALAMSLGLVGCGTGSLATQDGSAGGQAAQQQAEGSGTDTGPLSPAADAQLEAQEGGE